MKPQIITSKTRIRDLMPPYKEIPDEFKNPFGKNKWCNFVSDWFFCGIKDVVIIPKEGINKSEAMRHLAEILSSYEPKHEHKEAAVAYLASLWFNDVTYTKE